MLHLATIVVILTCLHRTVYTQNNIGRFGVVSDLHYGPELGSNPPSPLDVRYAQDSPMWLINSTIHAIGDEGIVKGPIDFILITGDLISHTLSGLPSDYATTYAKQSLTDIGATFETVFGSTNNKFLSSPVTCLGNNDLYPKYAAPNTTQAFFSMFASTWSSISSNPTAEQSFLNSGSYSVDIPIPSTNNHTVILRAISIHTNYWSVSNIYTKESDDPGGVFAFLQTELKKAAIDKVGVYIIGHIAPGVDHYAQSTLWQPKFTSTYQSIVQPYLGTTVLGQFYGHEHIALFRFLGDPNDSSSLAASAGPLRLHSSISPIYNNNPSFRVYTYNRDTLQILDFSEWYLNFTNGSNPVWGQQYASAKELYDLTSLDTHSYCSFVQHMYENTTFFDEYYANSYSLSSSPFIAPCDDTCKREFLCNAQFLDSSQYSDCITNDKRLKCTYSPLVTTSTSSTTSTPSTTSTSSTTSTPSTTSTSSTTSTPAVTTSTSGGTHHNNISTSHLIAAIVLIVAAVCIAVGMGTYFYIKRRRATPRYNVLW